MVRGITSSVTNQPLLLISFLAEMTAAGFLDECFKGYDPEVKLLDRDKVAVTYAVATLGMVADTATGWQFVPYIDGQAVARLDGMHTASGKGPLYNPKKRGVLAPNSYTDAALEKLPDSFTIRGCWFSNLEDMQTKALNMKKETFKKLFFKEVTGMKQVLEEVKITNVDPLKYTRKFSELPPDVQLWITSEDAPSQEFVGSNNSFLPNDAYLFVQGDSVSRKHPRSGKQCIIGSLIGGIKACSALARFERRVPLPKGSIRFDLAAPSNRMRVITVLSNAYNIPSSYTLLQSKLHKLGNATDRWVEYAKMVDSDKSAPLWRWVRPFLAIANDVAVEDASGKDPNIFYTPDSCYNRPHPAHDSDVKRRAATSLFNPPKCVISA